MFEYAILIVQKPRELIEEKIRKVPEKKSATKAPIREKTIVNIQSEEKKNPEFWCKIALELAVFDFSV